MDNITDKIIPDFSNLNRDQVPKEFMWRVEDIYPDMAAWEKDKALYFQMIHETDELIPNWTASAQSVYRLMHHVTELNKLEEKVYGYPRLFGDTDLQNSKWQALKGEIHTVIINLQSKLSFFSPDILALGREKIDEYMKEEPRLRDHDIEFDHVLRRKDHILSTDKESIVAQTHLFSGTPGKVSTLLNDVEIPPTRITIEDGKRIVLNTSNYILYRESKNRKVRAKVMESFWKNHAKFKNTHAALLDGQAKTHYFSAKIRNYKSCVDAALFSDAIDTQVYHTLIDTVKKNLNALHRYMKLKARLLKIEDFCYYDLYASSIPSVQKKYTIEEAKTLIVQALQPLGKEYHDVLKTSFDAGWMDIYPNKSKRSGAYSSGVYGVHPYVLMNYNGNLNNVTTLAHEFGHSLHSWFSDNNQSYAKAQYPIFLAEIASTFNETLLVQHLLKTETDDLVKLYILDQYLEEFRGTLFRQTLFAEFELLLHQEVEQGKTLTADWLNQLYLKLTREYYGHHEAVVNVPQYVENEWSFIHHFYYNFYVYQYSTGIVSSTALAEMVLTGGPEDVKRYMDFLKSGGSNYPLETLKKAGVDLTTSKPIEVAIHRFDTIVTEMEEISKRLKF